MQWIQPVHRGSAWLGSRLRGCKFKKRSLPTYFLLPQARLSGRPAGSLPLPTPAPCAAAAPSAAVPPPQQARAVAGCSTTAPQASAGGSASVAAYDADVMPKVQKFAAAAAPLGDDVAKPSAVVRDAFTGRPGVWSGPMMGEHAAGGHTHSSGMQAGRRPIVAFVKALCRERHPCTSLTRKADSLTPSSALGCSLHRPSLPHVQPVPHVQASDTSSRRSRRAASRTPRACSSWWARWGSRCRRRALWRRAGGAPPSTTARRSPRRCSACRGSSTAAQAAVSWLALARWIRPRLHGVRRAERSDVSDLPAFMSHSEGLAFGEGFRLL